MADEEKRAGYTIGGAGYGPGLAIPSAAGDVIAPTGEIIGDGSALAGAGVGPSYLGGYNPYFGYGFGFGHCCKFFPGFVGGYCVDQLFLQIICILKGECVKVLLAHSPAICGRLIQIEVNYISVSVDGTVAYIPLADVVAIIPVN